MNRNNLIKDLIFKIFRSGNPIYFYIGINSILFLLTALTAVFLQLTGTHFSVFDWVNEYFGLPAKLSSLPYHIYAFLSYQFFHDGLLHIAFNMLGLYWFGNIFMNFMKARQFHFLYIFGGIIGGFFYITGLNVIPLFRDQLDQVFLVGASASIMAIIFGAATLVPNYAVYLMFFGEVKLKYLAIIYFILNLLSLASLNAGGSLAHIGGAFAGFIFIKSLQKGKDWSKIFERKPKLRVVKNEKPVKKPEFKGVSQEEIDSILDKISTSGYDKLTSAEKEKLFKASKD